MQRDQKREKDIKNDKKEQKKRCKMCRASDLDQRDSQIQNRLEDVLNAFEINNQLYSSDDDEGKSAIDIIKEAVYSNTSLKHQQYICSECLIFEYIHISKKNKVQQDKAELLELKNILEIEFVIQRYKNHQLINNRDK